MKILAAIVTYNRVHLLERCIDHVRAQTRPPDRLLVVNNSSSDGTVEMLKQKCVDFVTQPNLGSAGGWARAIGDASEQGFDAVWLMDDDGYPDPDALRVLEQSLGAGVGCVSSVVVREEQPSHFVFPFPKLNAEGNSVIFDRKRKIARLEDLRRLARGDLYPFVHLFNGALVSMPVAKRVGNVSPDFFMQGDEVEYFMRLKKVSLVFSNLSALHFHPDVATRPISPEKFYYYVKNSIILHRKFFDQPLLRNVLAVAVVVARTATRNSPATALSYLAGSRAPVLWKAVARGLSGRLGKDFDG